MNWSRVSPAMGGIIAVLLTVVTLPHIGAAPRDITTICHDCDATQRHHTRLSKRSALSSLSALASSASISSSLSYSSSSTAGLSTTILSPPPVSVVDAVLEDAGANIPDATRLQEDAEAIALEQARIREEQVRLVREEILRKLHMVDPPTAEDIARANISEQRMQEMYQRYYQSVREVNAAANQQGEDQHALAYRDELYTFRSSDGPPGNISFWDWFSPQKLRIYVPVQFPRDVPRTLHNATLHLFMTPPGIINGETTALVRIHQLLAPPRANARTPRRFVTSKEVSLTETAWVTFQIGEAVSMWISDPSTNHGLEVECEFVLTTHLFVSGYSNGRVPASRADREDTRPYVDVVLRERTGSARRRRRRSNLQGWMADPPPKCTQLDPHDDCCKRRNLSISLRELGFEWILAPEEYNAHYCGGECSNLYNLADTHALIRAMIRLQKPRSLPQPCCTPSKLGPLPVLYLHKVNINKTEPALYALPNMVIESCGCS